MPLPSLSLAFRSAVRTAAGLPRVRVLTLVSLGVVLSIPAPAHADQWTDVSGQHTINADFLGVWGNKAVFAMPNGQRRSVELKNLQAESRLRALDLAEQRKAHREKVKAELLELQAAERAPAAARIAGPQETASEYQPLPDNASLQETLDHRMRQIRAGHPRVMWDTLPKSYQQDIESLVVEFGKKMPPQVWNDQVAMIDRLTGLLASREEWIFTHPQVLAMVSGMTNDEQQARSNYRALIGLVQTLTDPQNVSLERLQQGNVDGLIADLDKKTAGYLQPFLPLIEPSLPTSLIADMVDDTHANVTVVLPGAPAAPAGQPQPGGQAYPGSEGLPGSEAYPGSGAYPSAEMSSMEGGAGEMYSAEMQSSGTQSSGMQGAARGGTVMKMIRVEGRWVSEPMAATWKQDIEALRGRIAQLPAMLDANGFVIDGLRQWVSLNLSPLESADSREAFHSGMDQIVADVALLVMQSFGRSTRQNNANDPYGAGYGEAMGGGNEMQYQNEATDRDAAAYEAIMQGAGMEAAQPPLNVVPQP